MSNGLKLFLLWLMPGVPPPGPFGADQPSMSDYNEFFSRVRCKSFNALQLKRGWKLWYDRLPWYEQSVGSADTLRDANSRLTAFRVMNGEDSFGADTIRLGDSGFSVAQWQKVLGLKQTGIFDKVTAEATKNYQRGRNLDPDGIVGPATWATVPVKTSIKLPGTLTLIGSSLVAGGLVAVTISPVKRK